MPVTLGGVQHLPSPLTACRELPFECCHRRLRKHVRRACDVTIAPAHALRLDPLDDAKSVRWYKEFVEKRFCQRALVKEEAESFLVNLGVKVALLTAKHALLAMLVQGLPHEVRHKAWIFPKVCARRRAEKGFESVLPCPGAVAEVQRRESDDSSVSRVRQDNVRSERVDQSGVSAMDARRVRGVRYPVV